MGLEILTQADMVLNSCGRPVPPKGFKFVDLPRIIPFHATAPQYASGLYFSEGGEGGEGVTYKNAAGNGETFAAKTSTAITLNFVAGSYPTLSITVVGTAITFSGISPTGVGGVSITALIAAVAANASAAALVTVTAVGNPSDFFQTPAPPATQAIASGPFTPSKILITAVNPGAAGNNIVVIIGTESAQPPLQAESVTVTTAGGITTITYLPATDAGGKIIYNPPTQGTNLQLLAALAGNAQAAALITATLYSGPIAANGYPHFPAVGSAGPFNLTGGSDGYPTNAVLPFQNFVENNSNTLFICKGIMLQTDPVQIRIKWPNGRYWNQFPSGNPLLSAGACFPQGTGGNLFALDEEVPIPAGGKVTVEMSGTNGGPVDVYLWGVLRYLLKDTGIGQGGAVDGKTCIIGYPAQAQAQGPPSCLIGYPVNPAGASGIKMINDPVQVLKMRPRFSCWPNGNIFAPEFRLGNQCETDTPPGYEDESFTFFSGIPAGTPYVIPAGGQSYSNPVGIPGQEDLIIRRWRAITTWNAGPVGPTPIGTPVVQIRLPNGYSVTGGDQIPINLGYWYPVFPTLRVIAGTVLILDITDTNETIADGTVNVTIEFDAAKRRKIQ